jgi:hypothetical protein
VSWHLVEKFNPGVMLDGDYIAALHPFDYSNAAQLDYAYDTFRVLVSHHIAHAIQDFIINWVFETPAQFAQLCHLFKDPEHADSGVSFSLLDGRDRTTSS